jgi:predicted nucleic acid-binding Zn ribbon protein
MKDDPISICPACSGAVKRLLYPVGVVFKGSGWYITDSRKPEATAESGDSQPAETKSAETKPAETPAAETRSETVTTS